MSLSLDHEDAEPEARQKERFAAFAKMFGEGRSFSGHERNCCYLNPGNALKAQGRFVNISAASGLDYPDDARAIAVLDWDQDGDLDVWASNRNAPRLRLLRNEIPRSGNFVTFQLVGNGQTTNRDGIGARVELLADPKISDEMHKSIGTLRAGEGFLAQNSKWLHFGLRDNQQVDKVRVSWPGGEQEVFSDVQVNQRNRLVQGKGIATTLAPSNRNIRLNPNVQDHIEPAASTILRLVTPATMPPIPYVNWNGKAEQFHTKLDKPTLLVLWASWCQPCLQELQELTHAKEQLSDMGLEVIALSVDGIGADKSDPINARTLLNNMHFPFRSGMATEELMKGLQKMHDRQAAVKRPLPLPTSILLNSDRELVAIYKGPLQIDSLTSDIQHLGDSNHERFAHAAKLPGRVIHNDTSEEIWRVAEAEQRFKTADFFEKYNLLDPAISEYGRILSLWPIEPFEDDANHNAQEGDASDSSPMRGDERQKNRRAQIQALAYTSRGKLQQRKGSLIAAIDDFENAVSIKPDNPHIYFTLGKLKERVNETSKAIDYFGSAIRYAPSNPEAYLNRAKLYQTQGEADAAIEDLNRLIALDPKGPEICVETGQLLLVLNDRSGALRAFSRALELDPENVPSLANRGALYAASGKYNLATKDFSSAIQSNTNSPAAYNNFAWMLATCNDAQYRDGNKAVIYAKRACDLLDWNSQDALDTLAASAAETGNWEDAIKWQKKAIELADESSRKELRERLKLYQSETPYHE